MVGVLSITIAIVIVIVITIYLHVCIYTIIVSVVIVGIANWDVMVDCDVGVVNVLQHLVISG